MSNDKIYIPAEPLVECPACGLPAEITDRFVLNAAPAPVEHVKIACVQRHWFTVTVDLLVAADPHGSGATKQVGQMSPKV